MDIYYRSQSDRCFVGNDLNDQSSEYCWPLEQVVPVYLEPYGNGTYSTTTNVGGDSTNHHEFIQSVPPRYMSSLMNGGSVNNESPIKSNYNDQLSPTIGDCHELMLMSNDDSTIDINTHLMNGISATQLLYNNGTNDDNVDGGCNQSMTMAGVGGGKLLTSITTAHRHDKCIVCGDASTGFHYDVPSCNGCKTFFRRTIITKRKFQCTKGGNCQFDKDHRCACRACRFLKCVNAGMNPKSIQYGSNKLVDMNEELADLIDMNRKNNETILMSNGRNSEQQSLSASSSSSSSSSSPTNAVCQIIVDNNNINSSPLLTKSIALCNDRNANLIGTLLYLEIKSSYLRESTYQGAQAFVEMSSIIEQLTQPIVFGQIDRYQAISKWPERVKKHNKFDISLMQQRLEEYQQNGKIDIDSINTADVIKSITDTSNNVDNVTTIDMMSTNDKALIRNVHKCGRNWQHVDLSLCIEYAKTFDIFQQLSLQDKCILLQNITMANCILCEAYYSYEQKSDTIIFPDGLMPIKRPTGLPHLNQQCYSQILEPIRRLELDKTEFVLLRAIAFFNADTYGLSADGSQKIGAYRQKHLEALFEYVCAKRGIAGPGQFGAMLAAIQSFYECAEKHRYRVTLVCIQLQRNPFISTFFDEIVLKRPIVFNN